MNNSDKTPPLTKQAMVEALTFDKPTLYPHQQELIEQAALSPELTVELEQYAKRTAHRTNRHEVFAMPYRGAGKTLAVASALAAMASVTGWLSHSEPEMQYLDNPLIDGYDLGTLDDVAVNVDWSEIEARINAYIDAPKPEPIMYQQLGRAKRIPMEEQTEAEAKASYLMYNTQSPKGREGANNGKAEKALAKRRAANKVARKARRK